MVNKGKNLNGKRKGNTTRKQGADMGNILKWLNSEQTPRQKRKKTTDNAEARQTRSKMKKTMASTNENSAGTKSAKGATLQTGSKNSEKKSPDELIKASTSGDNSDLDLAGPSHNSSGEEGSLKCETPKDELVSSKNDTEMFYDKKTTDHDMSPSPESASTKSGYETGDTEKYANWSDEEESQEARHWSNEGATTAKDIWKRKVDKTKDLKRQLKLVSKWSQQDTKAYREGYPGKEDNGRQRDNYLFYTNQISSRPDGGKIEEILETWKGDYSKLERHHGYIQWLFPIRERGMNWVSQELQTHEMEDIKKDAEASERFIRAYELMLDFYGLKLKDRQTGELERAENWEERLAHLNRSYHNYLRITRILKSLGELGCEYMKRPCVEFLLEEAIERQTIPNAAKSCVEYWLHTLRDEGERKQLLGKVKAFVDAE